MIRMEKILQAHQNSLNGCLAFVGDSRIAFHVEASKFSGSCSARNYAFPGLNSETTLEIANRLTSAETIVLGVTEGMFQRPTRPVWEKLVSFDLIRFAFLGQQRLLRWVDSLYGIFPLSDGWSWDGVLGRWAWQSLNERVFITAETRDAETRAMAVSYYRTDRIPPDIDRMATDLIRDVGARARQLAVVMPPSLPGFIAISEEVAPGEFARYRSAVINSALSAGHLVIECKTLAICGLELTDFADPVHLNAKGAAVWTTFLLRELARYETATNSQMLP